MRTAIQALRDGAGEAAERARRRTPQHGRVGRSQRKDPYLQLPAEPHDRPSHRPHAASARYHYGRPARPGHRSVDPALSDPKDEGARRAGRGGVAANVGFWMLDVGAALLQGYRLLDDERISAPRLTAEVLLSHALHRD